MITLQIIFWFCLSLIVYTYLLFPAILTMLSRNKQDPDPPFPPSQWPSVSVLIAAFNEEKVIGEKIRSLLKGQYPLELLEILVGSDASTDQTNRILQDLQQKHPVLHLTLFAERQGKPGIINQLAEKARGEILVITDANVILQPDTLTQLISAFMEKRIGLVDSRLVNPGVNGDGISRQESFYISREVSIKHHESVLWGSMMGPFGGCYAVRKSLYQPVPDTFLVDDFFINMSVLKQGFYCISKLEAIVHEKASTDTGEEFRRKKRISAGNFQNLSVFWPLIFHGSRGVGFCFLSHKVIRWLVPFLVLITLAASLILGTISGVYLGFALAHLGLFLTPVIDHLLRKIKIQSIPLRFISHFVLMNLALLAGFFRYLGGIKNNVWQPTSRTQDHAQFH
jgi:cellulose synthase/poly-beta-1,6-N-acetylglucosamine synthase-like glycosyltransferase